MMLSSRHGEERKGKNPRADLHRMRGPDVALYDLAEDRAEATDQRLPVRSLRLDHHHLERKAVKGPLADRIEALPG